MNKLTQKQLLDFNVEGLIPGPHENEEDFAKRCAYCLDLKTSLATQCQKDVPFVVDSENSIEILQEAFIKTCALYDIHPSWIPLFFSNYKLTPWQGGCAWIFQQNEDSPTGAFFQLRQAFRSSKTYLGLYQREELIAHEIAHVGRMMFHEPQFEELLAYRSSESKFRRYFGPFIQAPWEGVLFIFILLLIFMGDIFTVSLGYVDYYQGLMPLKLIPITLILYGLSRLTLRQRQLNACLTKLQGVLRDQKTANAILFRLQDREIKMFAKMSYEAILDYAKQMSKQSLRWWVISKAYLK